MSPRRIDGPTRRGVGVQWEQICNPIDVFILEAELYQLSVFHDRAELLVSYPDWRREYLAATAANLEARKPVKRIVGPGPAHCRADRAHHRAIDLWMYQRAQTPPVERWYLGFE